MARPSNHCLILTAKTREHPDPERWHLEILCRLLVLFCESYGDAAGILKHLENVDKPLNAVLDGPAELMRLEVHGPKAENDKLKEALGPLGCVFYNTEWGFRNAV